MTYQDMVIACYDQINLSETIVREAQRIAGNTSDSSLRSKCNTLVDKVTRFVANTVYPHLEQLNRAKNGEPANANRLEGTLQAIEQEMNGYRYDLNTLKR